MDLHDRAVEKLQRSLERGAAHTRRPPNPTELARGEDLQESLGRLRGVRQARVQIAHDAVEVTVLTLPEKSETETDAEVRSIAHRVGLDPTTLRIRVMGARNRHSMAPRRKLSSLSTTRYGHRFTAQVTLELEGDLLVGEVDVPIGRRFEIRSVARAILESVRRLIPYALQLEHVEILNFGAERLAVVSVSSRDDILVGSAFVRNDELDAVARATLDAINRVLNLGSQQIPKPPVKKEAGEARGAF